MKKLLSMILALAMLISLVPATFADGEAAQEYSGITVKYDLVVGPGYNHDGTTDNLKNYTMENTNGFWAYYAQLQESSRVFTANNSVCVKMQAAKDEWIALEIYVPKAGKYDVSLNYAKRKTGDAPVEKAGMWILPGTGYTKEEITAALTADTAVVKEISFSTGTSKNANDNDSIPESFCFPNAGTHLIVFKCTEGRINADSDVGYMFPHIITLDGDGDEKNYIPMTLKASLDKKVLSVGSEENATAKMTVTGAYMSSCVNEIIEDFGSVSYTSSNSSVADVNASGEITAVGVGTAVITATATNGAVAKRAIKVADKAATDEVSTVQFMATSTLADNAGVTTNVSGYVIGETTDAIAVGETVEVTASDVEGYIFRGWKRGSKDNGVWVSENKTYSFPLLTNIYLTAIYDVDTATDTAVNVEFYNFNGQFLASKEVNGEGFAVLAEGVTPTLTGYNSFFWTTDGENEVAADKVFDKLTRVVAKFTDTDSFAVTVPANVESNKPSGKYAYDTEIAMTAENAGFWKVNGKTVAYGTSYTYCVWSAATIVFEAKANDNKPIISIDGNSTDGAKMISYDANGASIVEAGILFGRDATIASAGSRAVSREARGNVSGQFTARPYDDNETIARGYLIYNDNGTYRVIYAD